MTFLPIITLLVLATVVPELFTGSTPLVGFFNPGLFVFLFLGYGVAVLLIREFAVRVNLHLRGLIFWGLGYGLFNEGLLAKTLITQQHLPVDAYDQYGVLFGISFPWAAGINTWHAFASVLFPIYLTHYFFPRASQKPWMNTKLAAVLGILLVTVASLVFLGTNKNGLKGTPLQLAILLGLMAGLFVTGLRFKGLRLEDASNSALKPLLLGFSVFIPFWALAAIAKSKANPALFFVALIGVMLAYAWLLKRKGWLSLPAFLFFGVGWYLQNAIQALGFILLGMHNPTRAITTAIVDGLIVFGLRWAIRRASQMKRQPVS